MEEPRMAAAQVAPQVLHPPSVGQTQHPPPNSKKRPLDFDSLMQNTNYFKIRAVIKDLRPYVLEVLRILDFRNCKASHEIREQLKILISLNEHMKADLGTSKQVQEQSQKDTLSGLEKRVGEDGGAYVVGGSVFGWNFVTFMGKEPVYYGVTKEQFGSGTVSLN